MTDLDVRPQITDPETDDGGPKVAHIVKDKNKVTEAYVNGTPLEALCGERWIPSRSPDGLPVCEACKQIYQKIQSSGQN